MTFFDAEMVEIIMKKRPEYFTSEERKGIEYENGPFGQIPHVTVVMGSKAEDVLYTANATMIKYGRQKAIDYINHVMKKGA
jgi:hypothetical protein